MSLDPIIRGPETMKNLLASIQKRLSRLERRPIGDLQAANNLSDLLSEAVSRQNLGIVANRTTVNTSPTGTFTQSFGTGIVFASAPTVIATVQNAGTAHRIVVINTVAVDQFTGTLFSATSGNPPALDTSAARLLNWVAIGTF